MCCINFNNLIMFPWKSSLWHVSLFPSFFLEWGFMWSPVACIWLKELQSLTCSRGEWRQANAVSYMFDVTQQRALSLEALCCETTTQHSYKLRMPCQLSALLTFPPSSFPLMPVKNFQAEKMRQKDAGVDVRRKTGRRKKKSRGWLSDSLQSVHPMPAWAWLHPLSAAARHTCINPVWVRMHVGHSSTQPQLDYHHQSGSNTQDNNWLCLFSLWHLRNHLNVAEPTVWLVTMQMYRFYCSFKYRNPTATNNQYTISNSSHTMWLVWWDSFA